MPALVDGSGKHQFGLLVTRLLHLRGEMYGVHHLSVDSHHHGEHQYA